ncbi:MAG TPA: class I SAM-dependent methyltransferase [Silvibacterium sp.]|nr:class I SAM-dependent methyltransferase [Silvibacterium sp.]
MNPLETREHWDRVYGVRSPEQVSWFRPHLETSIALIERAGTDRDTAIIDVGGGTSTLVDDLLGRGYTNVTVLDISQSAIEIAKKRLGEASRLIRWMRADVAQALLPAQTYDVWHDRAVFHFLTQPEQRLSYVSTVASSVRPGGHIIVSTFGPEGPTRCSGLDVVRYGPDSLRAEFGHRFRLLESSTKSHQTPFGTTQQFLYCCFILES